MSHYILLNYVCCVRLLITVNRNWESDIKYKHNNKSLRSKNYSRAKVLLVFVCAYWLPYSQFLFIFFFFLNTKLTFNNLTRIIRIINRAFLTRITQCVVLTSQKVILFYNCVKIQKWDWLAHNLWKIDRNL